MRRLCVRLLLALGLLGIGASPAPACLNDRESKKSEREFRSSYQEFKSGYEEPQAEPPPPETSSSDFWVTKLPAGAGVVLLAGALVLGLTRGRRP